MSATTTARWIAGALLATFVSLSIWAAVHDSVTVDEFAIVPSGYVKLTHLGEVNWLNPVNPPLIQYLLAVPWLAEQPAINPEWWGQPQEELRWKVGYQFMVENAPEYDSLFFLPRLVSLVLGLLLVIYAWKWSAELFGKVGGLVTLGLCCLCPTLIAHSHLATVDIGATAFLVMASYYFWRLMRIDGPWNWKAGLAFAVSFALALGSKYTAPLLVPVFAGIAVGVACRRPSRATLKSLGLSFAVTVLVTFLVLGALYGFEGMGSSATESGLASQALRPLASGKLASLPIPLPLWYFKGWDQEIISIELAKNIFYFMGRVTTEKHPAYFLVAMLVKSPIPHLLLIAGGFVALLITSRRPASISRQALVYLLIPALWFLGLFSFTIGSNLGIRYVMFSLVCFYVAAGGLGMWACKRWRKILLASALVLSAASVLRLSPHLLSYFNEAAGGPQGGRRFLSDSNLDWGQDLKALKQEMQKLGYDRVYLSYFGPVAPAIYDIAWSPLANREGRPGLVAISIHHLLGIDPFDPTLPQFAAPYRERTPIGSAGYSILLFEEK